MATRLAMKHLDYYRTAFSIAKSMKAQMIHRSWGRSFVQGFTRVILNRVRDNVDSMPHSRGGLSDQRDADAEFNFFNPPSAGFSRL